MVSAASTVIEFLTPDTLRRAQWPVISTVLDTPLTLTMLSLQAIVRFSPTPETETAAPGGGADAVAVGWVRVTDGTVAEGTLMLGMGRGEVLTRVVLGAGDPTTDRKSVV